MAFGKDEKILFDVVEHVKYHSLKPLWVKLTPNVTDIALFAQVVESAGGDAITVANSYQGIAIDCERECFRLGNITGGLTGPAIKPLTQYAVWKTVAHTNLPVIASGGIFSVTDALEYFLLGAKAVQIGTAALINPHIFSEIFEEMVLFFRRKRIDTLKQWIGRLQ